MAVVRNKPDMNFGIWAENGDIETPSSEKVSYGWDIEKPFKEQMNWVQNRQDKMLQYINQHGIPEWDSRTDYPKDAYTVRSGILYKSLSQNTDKDPSLNTSIWEVAFANQKSFNTLSAEVGKIKSQDGYLSQYVQVNSPYMNATCRGVGYTGDNVSLGLFFDSIGNPELRGGGNYSFNGTNDNPDDVLRRSDLDAIIKEALKYKVGDLYLTTSATPPEQSLGYGTWEAYGQGRTLVGISGSSSSNPDWTKFTGSQFGSYTHILKTNEIPPHDHENNIPTYGESGAPNNQVANGSKQDGTRAVWRTENTGGGEAHNNVQPSVVIFIWRRIA